MFDTISRTSAKDAGLTLGQFRSAVNYENTTNKGYVRFTRDDNGRITLGKVNNQLDVFVNLRQNVNAELNKEVRRQFVEALYRDLDYVKAADRQEIIKLAAGGKVFQDDEGKSRVELSDEALSRTKLKEIFDKFDAQYNTTEGRTKIIKTLLEKKAEKLGIGKTNYEECCRRLTGHSSFNEVLEKYTETAGTGETEFGREKMAVDEQTFRNFLWQLDQYSEGGAKKDQLNKNLIDMIAARLPKTTGAAWGFEIAQDMKTKLAPALKDLLELDYGLTIPEWKPDKTNPNLGSINLLDVFVDKVLPRELRAVTDNAIALGLPKDASEEERTRAVSDLFDLDHIAELAKDFFTATTHAIDGEGAGGRQVEGGDKTGEGEDAIHKVADEVKNTAEGLANMRVAKNVRAATANIATMANIPMSEARKVSADLVDQAKDPFTQLKARVNMFVDQFIADRYKVNPGKERSFCVELQNVCMETTNKCLVVAQLQYGERSESDLKNPETGKNRYVARSEGMGKFVENTWKAFQEACSKGKENKGLNSRLFSHLMPNLVNAKVQALIENVNDNSINRSVQMGEDAEKEAVQTLLAHKKLFDDQSGKILEKFDATCAAFDKALKPLVKSQRITEDERKAYLRQIEDACQEAVNDAVDVWLGGAPYTSLDGEEGADNLLRPIEEQLRKAASRMREKVMLAKSYRLPGSDIMRGAKQQTMQSALAVALGKVDEKVRKDLGTYVNEDEVRKTLLGADGPLEQAFNKLLFAREGRIKIKTGEKFDWNAQQEGLKADLTAEAEKMVKAWYAYGRDLLKRVGETVTNAVKGVIADPDDKEWHRYASLKGNERRDFIDGLVSDAMMQAREAVVRTPLLRALRQPDLIKEKDMGISAKKDAKLLVLPSNAENIWPSLEKVRIDRAETVKKWAEDEKQRNAIVSGLVDELRGRYNAVWQDERRILIEKRAETVFKEAAERGILEAAGGMEKFYARMTEQIRTGLKPTLAEQMDAFAKLFTAFSQKAPAIEGEFDLAEKAEEKNLVLRAEARKRFVALEKVPNIEEATKLYQKMRANEVDSIIKEKKEDFERFEKIFDAIRNKVDTSDMKNSIWYVGEGMSKVALPSKDPLEQGDYIQAFENVYRPKIRTHFQNLVAQDLEKFCGMTPEEIGSFVDGEMNSISNKLFDVRKFTHYAGPGAATPALPPLEEDYIRAAGFGKDLDNEEMKPRILRLVGALQNSEKWRELLLKKTNAHLACAWAEYTGTAVSEKDRKDANCLVEYVGDYLKGYLSTVTSLEDLEAKKKVANALIKAEFDRWQGNRQLTEEKALDGATVIQRAQEIFYTDISFEATNIFKEGKPLGELFNEEWFDRYFERVRANSNSNMLASWLASLKQNVLVSYQELYKEIFEPLSVDNEEAKKNPALLAGNMAVAANRKALDVLVQKAFNKAVLEFSGDKEDFAPFYAKEKEGLTFQNLCMAKIKEADADLQALVEICKKRFGVAVVAAKAAEDAWLYFEERYFVERMFGKKNDLDGRNKALVGSLEDARENTLVKAGLWEEKLTLAPIEILFGAMRKMLEEKINAELARPDGNIDLPDDAEGLKDYFMKLLENQYAKLMDEKRKDDGAFSLKKFLNQEPQDVKDFVKQLNELKGVLQKINDKNNMVAEETKKNEKVKANVKAKKSEKANEKKKDEKIDVVTAMAGVEAGLFGNDDD